MYQSMPLHYKLGSSTFTLLEICTDESSQFLWHSCSFGEIPWVYAEQYLFRMPPAAWLIMIPTPDFASYEYLFYVIIWTTHHPL